MRHYQAVSLRLPIEASIRSGNPWIFEDALYPSEIQTGNVVDVYSTDGDFLARGIYDGDSPIRVRVFTLFQDQDLNQALIDKRIKSALKRRPFPSPDTTGFRLLHGEGDLFPGLVCDVYGETAVLRPDGVAAERWLKGARQTIGRLLPIKYWAIRRARVHTQGKAAAQWWGDKPEEPVRFLEGGLTYEVDPIEGQKTGFFLDQRANRRRLAKVTRGKRLLNLFGYTGGFSLAAAAEGAARTTTVDLAAPAIQAARRHFELNDLPSSAHEFVAADVFDYLEPFGYASAPFEVLVCDPPSFAHRRDDVPQAMAKYVELFARCLEIMPDESTVALASCSSHIHRQRFEEILREATMKAGVSYVLSGLFGADSDHPTLPGFPEGDYLQFALGTIAR